MCLIVHKPKEARIPEDLVAAALAFNTDGWGLMGIAPDQSLIIERHAFSDFGEIRQVLARHRDAELVLHLRRRTRGAADRENTHPLAIAPGLHLMHNGTLPLYSRVAGRSDSWHFVNDLLRPLHLRHPGLISDPDFLRLLELSMKADNKAVLLDSHLNRIVILNRAHGAEFEGLWLSNTRWLDRRVLPLSHTPQTQLSTQDIERLHFG